MLSDVKGDVALSQVGSWLLCSNFASFDVCKAVVTREKLDFFGNLRVRLQHRG